VTGLFFPDILSAHLKHILITAFPDFFRRRPKTFKACDDEIALDSI